MAVTTTLADLKTTLSHLLDDEGKKIYSDSRLREAIRLAVEELEDVFAQWDAKGLVARTTLSVVSGTIEYAIDKEVKTIEKVTVLKSDGTERQLTPILFTDADAYQAEVSLSSLGPLYYYRKANNIGILPKPSSSFTVYVYHTSMSDLLTADTDALTMPPWVRRALLWKAASYAATTKGDRQNVALFEKHYADSLRELEMVLARWQKQRPERVGISWWDEE